CTNARVGTRKVRDARSRKREESETQKLRRLGAGYLATTASVYRRLAEKALYCIGTLYERGTGMPRDLDDRVFQFACRVVDLFEMLHAKGGAARAIGYQLLDAGTSIGSNYEEASAGQTKADFIAKLAISRKESRESLFWLRLIAAKRLLDPTVVADDIAEARQLTAIFRAIIVKARSSAQRG
ncbi:MAG TPA: four helix bundle protein, partial [Vicinamibacterales bacterium]